jgi:hypothetical protein
MSSSLVVVHNLDVPGSILAPFEANAPLIVDANAMLPTPTAVQGLEPVAWRNAQILKPFRCVKGEKLGSGSTLDLVWQDLYRIAGKHRGRPLIGEALYH